MDIIYFIDQASGPSSNGMDQRNTTVIVIEFESCGLNENAHEAIGQWTWLCNALDHFSFSHHYCYYMSVFLPTNIYILALVDIHT